ncbi:MAG: metal-sulfur cluster assembly factor [Candidatus Absconditabacterales bacterium]|jgi:metal-sulfur cluster biosynthetic enzyme
MASKKISKQHALLPQIQEKLKTVYDPEFPMIDLYTLGLIYDISVDEKKKKIHILMTFTTPACPMAELIQELVRNAIDDILPEYIVEITVTFEPMRTYTMIKDEDLKRMFE